MRAEVEAALQLWPTHGDGKWKQKLLIRDAIADITLQQVLTRPREFDVIATLNLNGDYLSDALAAQVGGIGIAPGGNINYETGHAIFEATHGTAPKYANLDKVNPGSVILSGVTMLLHLALLNTQYVKGIVVIRIRRVARVLGLGFEDQPNVVALRRPSPPACSAWSPESD